MQQLRGLLGPVAGFVDTLAIELVPPQPGRSSEHVPGLWQIFFGLEARRGQRRLIEHGVLFWLAAGGCPIGGLHRAWPHRGQYEINLGDRGF